MPRVTASSRSRSLELAMSAPAPRRPTPASGVADEWKTLAPQAAVRGEFRRALELYRSLAAVEANVPLHRIRAGDCLVKLGLKREALGEYRVAAGAYLALGMHAHARSAWRLVLGIVPGDADATARLAALDARVRGAKAGTPPPVPVTAGAIPAPPPRKDAPRAANTPTASDAEVRAEIANARGAANTPTASDAEVRAENAASRPAANTPSVLPAAIGDAIDARTAVSRAPDAVVRAGAGGVLGEPFDSLRSLRVNGVEQRSLRVNGAEHPFDSLRSLRVNGGAVERAVVPAISARELLALEFADVDDDDDRIWIDLDEIVETPARAPRPLVPPFPILASETTEPVAFFAMADDDDSPPSRQSGPAEGPRGSLVDEDTKPVPPPEE